MKKENFKKEKEMPKNMNLDELIKAALSEMAEAAENEEIEHEETEHEWSEGFEDKIKNLIADADNIINADTIKENEIKADNGTNTKVTEISFWRKNKKAFVNAASLLIIFGIGFYGMKNAGLFGTAKTTADLAQDVASDAIDNEVEANEAEYGGSVQAEAAAETPALNRMLEDMQKSAPGGGLKSAPSVFSLSPENADVESNSSVFEEIEGVSGLDLEVDEEILAASDIAYELYDSGDIKITYFSNMLGTTVKLTISSGEKESSEKYSFDSFGRHISLTFENEDIEDELKNAEMEKWKIYIK